MGTSARRNIGPFSQTSMKTKKPGAISGSKSVTAGPLTRIKLIPAASLKGATTYLKEGGESKKEKDRPMN